MREPTVSVVIGSFNRPGRARTFLACLVDQSFEDWEAVLTDNSDDPVCAAKIEEMCKIDPRIRYEWTKERAFDPLLGISSLYDAAEIGIAMTTGKWIWAPNEDDYACPWFLERMLQTANDSNLDFVYCTFVQGRHDVPHHFFDTYHEACRIDKMTYMIKREWFPIPWPGKQTGYGVADGLLVNELIAKGIRHGKINQCLCVHN